MTAEEKLKELYENVEYHRKMSTQGALKIMRVSLMPEHIDLIANLVIERMKNE